MFSDWSAVPVKALYSSWNAGAGVFRQQSASNRQLIE
jgi:hypothetical protein